MAFNAQNVVVKDKTTSNIENTLSPNQLNLKVSEQNLISVQLGFLR